jgi:hypothetical protein
MVESGEGRKLGDEVWNEIVEILEKEAPDIRGTIAAS